MAKTKIGVLISGRGSNLSALINAAKDPDYPAEICLVISNRPKAKGLEIAHEAGISQCVIDHKAFETRDEFDAALSERLQEAGIEYVCLAGFMRILSPTFVTEWRGRVINIHPSLLPAFKGLNVHERMIDAGVKIAGCTVHFVDAQMDGGAIIGQAAVPIRADDTPEDLAARILRQEHKLYAECVRLVAKQKVRISGGKAILDAPIEDTATLTNPAVD